MGAVLAKFRKEKTTYEILEKLEQDIKDIEEYSVSTQARQKRYVGNFLVVSIGLYVIGFLVFYFLFFPPTWMERITYSVPLLIFPMIIFLLKRLVAWYFQRKLNKNNIKLTALRGQKKKVIEQVMDKETYKVALEILNRFADKSNGFKPTGAITPRVMTPVPQQQKSLIMTKQLSTSAMQLSQTPASSPSRLSAVSQNLLTSDRLGTPRIQTQSPRGVLTPVNTNQVSRMRTPYPVINQQSKGFLEKMVDYLIGDGPSNRFAMICKECFAHNGMAVQEEYEYAAFRCAFCNAMNPSRKLRPVAPKLPTSSPIHAAGLLDSSLRRSDSSSSTSSREKDSGSDSEDDQKETIEELNTAVPPEELGTQMPDEVVKEEVEQILKVEKSEDEKKND